MGLIANVLISQQPFLLLGSVDSDCRGACHAERSICSREKGSCGGDFRIASPGHKTAWSSCPAEVASHSLVAGSVKNLTLAYSGGRV